jgi:hypothetical protein
MATKTSAPEIFVCIDNLFYGDHGFVKKGERLRADHEAVRAHGEFFVPDGTASAVMAERLSRMHYPDPSPAPPAPAPVMMRAKSRFVARVERDLPVEKGDQFPVGDQVVVNNRARFERV